MVGRIDGAVLPNIASSIIQLAGTRRLSSSNQLRTMINCLGRFRFVVINHHEAFTVSEYRDLPEWSRSVT